jgi:Domain of unknown function (DUF4861)
VPALCPRDITQRAVDRIFRLRGDYERQPNAILTEKTDGLGWESTCNASHLSFDKRNAIGLFGKARPSLQLDRYATPGYVYHNYSPDGRDIYLVADALGIGAPARWVNCMAEHVADVEDRGHYIVFTGPVRAIVELTYKGWKIRFRNVTFHKPTPGTDPANFLEARFLDSFRIADNPPRIV